MRIRIQLSIPMRIRMQLPKTSIAEPDSYDPAFQVIPDPDTDPDTEPDQVPNPETGL
jgi:hypothetical protein